ncbi:purine-binding chemotaxis protein CheW [Sulfurospirillum diekertiae]|uniref:Chemotaxis protein CheW n=1 Tax=Sulfurospirillum diekertiae TaxID=1854492 RepID=A0A1Y0HQT9_9BACT|nr:chemotaxis protein CheW [Sulfurospirillum diekertiae]ARU49704.1 Chemotaxis protein CheW [Sulfurospirillum diekertiae]ASC94501.1 Chemotaxis protein CheW [Sulfurospirillum diekertiae]QIR75629.1 purine-binding chemotaxis protein CheW [Sulfurospirillum diekertiae]QIR78277.1 purine-binding chemotaxis protein CheW [Sulfurospirillum diekertiae]
MEENKIKGVGRVANRFLTFYLEEEIYGVKISDVKEIIAMMKTTPVPKTPRFIKGVMNLRGNIIPVVDMRVKFDMPEVEPQMYTAIVIITIEGKNIGFIVDKVEEVVNVDDENISPPPEFGSNIDTRFIENMAKQKNKVVMILDLVALFGEEELSLVQNLSKTISDKG